MNIEVWPFLVSRNPYIDYRTIVAPNFICDAGIPNLLARATDGDLTEPGYATYRKIEGSKVGDFSIIFRVVKALQKDINSEGGNEFLKDSFGREIYLIEGVVIKKTNKVSITNEDLEEVHRQVKANYENFWDCIDAPPVVVSTSFYLEHRETSSSLRLEEIQSLKLSNKVQSSENKSWQLEKTLPVGFRVSSIAINPKENTIAVKSYNSFVAIWSLSEYKRLASINKKIRSPINYDKIFNFDRDKAVAFSPDGTLIAFSIIQGTDRNNLLLCNAKILQEESIFKGHHIGSFGRIHSVAFSKDGKLVASASQDSTVKLWNLTTKEEYASLQHKNPVYTISFSPDGSILASGDSKGYVKFWDIRSKNELGFIHSEEWSSINSIDFNSDGSILAVGGDGDLTNGNHVELWSVSTKEVIHSLTEHSDPINSVAFSPDGQTLASGSQDRSVKLWDVKSGKELLTLPDDDGSSDKVTSVAFSSDGQTLVSSSEDGTVKIWRC
ncbi:WD40 repeat domain-containing protein [Cronbergia sp. UHCC 0137]|uniref:WD40 repeat domain-containing protein n=1 Tax=Cronbergia sp. UHCC 0137 TaxID=3110239 RepID=UPI002B218FE3|nr:WD40 repeat domain-containing protein [Cronbergia sp. UHCC 0137]MEA5619257.1 WD40 repeat domain-containing protein [Cronbergia sp. UHCC 0137]